MLVFGKNFAWYLKIKYFAENKKPHHTLKRTLLFFYIFFTTVLTSPALAAGASGTADPIVRLYPNPAISVVSLDLSKVVDRGYSIRVFSFLGRKMYETSNISQRVITLDLNAYNRGVYVYQVRDRNGKLVETGKFQVSK